MATTSLPSLATDEWQLVCAHMSPVALARFARTNTVAHAAARVVMNGANLSALQPSMNQGEVCDALGIEPAEARALPYSAERRRGTMGWFEVHIFKMKKALPVLLSTLGGWPALVSRLEMVAAKKRKRDDLTERRTAAAAKRRAGLDAWMAAERPVGPDICSVAEWEASLARRGAPPATSVALLGAYLGSSTLKAPYPLATVQEGVKRFEATQTEALASKAEAEAEVAARKAAVEAVLAARGHALDASLPTVQRYERNGWKMGVRTAEQVAEEVVDAALNAAAAAQCEAERVARQATELAAMDERRKALRAVLRRLKLTRGDAPMMYDAYVRDGQTAAGLASATEVVEAISLLATRRAELATALLAMGVQRSEWAQECDEYEEKGTMGERGPVTAEAVGRELASRMEEKRAIARAAEEREAEGRAAREAELESALSQLGGSRQAVQTGSKRFEQQWREFVARGTLSGQPTTATALAQRLIRQAEKLRATAQDWHNAPRACTTPSCKNQHRMDSPATGAYGPICGACERQGLMPREFG